MFTFEQVSKAGSKNVSVAIDRLILGGLTGQPEAVQLHLDELAHIGVKAPSKAPIYYHLSANLVTRSEVIQVLGNHTSGEAEPVILALADGLWLGVGSDHTDRKAETVDIALSKQMCQKPIGAQLWPLREVSAHWNDLILRSYITENGRQVVYQEGTLAAMLHPEILLDKLPSEVRPLPLNSLFMCGTTPAIGGIRPADRFTVELEDPVLERKLTHSYRVESLPHYV